MRKQQRRTRHPSVIPATTARAASRTLVRRREPATVAWVERTSAGAIAKVRWMVRSKRADLPEGSSLRAFCDELLALDDDAMMEVVFAGAHANPERIGCPSHAALENLVTGELGRDPVWDHVAQCYQCTIEIRDMRRVHGLCP